LTCAELSSERSIYLFVVHNFLSGKVATQRLALPAGGTIMELMPAWDMLAGGFTADVARNTRPLRVLLGGLQGYFSYSRHVFNGAPNIIFLLDRQIIFKLNNQIFFRHITSFRAGPPNGLGFTRRWENQLI
jgi:hypothetical protein